MRNIEEAANVFRGVPQCSLKQIAIFGQQRMYDLAVLFDLMANTRAVKNLEIYKYGWEATSCQVKYGLVVSGWKIASLYGLGNPRFSAAQLCGPGYFPWFKAAGPAHCQATYLYTCRPWATGWSRLTVPWRDTLPIVLLRARYRRWWQHRSIPCDVTRMVVHVSEQKGWSFRHSFKDWGWIWGKSSPTLLVNSRPEMP